VGDVAEPAYRPLDGLALGAADVGGVVEGTGGHRAGDAGVFGYLVECGLPS
jgi:hypothetical protein